MTCKALFLLAPLALAACEGQGVPPPAATAPAPAPPPALNTPPAEPSAPPLARDEAQASDDWREYALAQDVERLQRLDAAWTAGLRGASPADLEPLGALADSKAPTLANPHPAPGDYRCRTIKLGGMVGFAAYPWFRCRIALTPGGDLTLAKLTGSQRPVGKFYPDGERRLVYLGGMALGLNGETASAYGQAPERDQIGVLERIGDQRWRLLLPWPRVESDLDILELAK